MSSPFLNVCRLVLLQMPSSNAGLIVGDAVIMDDAAGRADPGPDRGACHVGYLLSKGHRSASEPIRHHEHERRKGRPIARNSRIDHFAVIMK